MDDATRLQYLEAMGIDVWVPRHLPMPQAAIAVALPVQPLSAASVTLETQAEALPFPPERGRRKGDDVGAEYGEAQQHQKVGLDYIQPKRPFAIASETSGWSDGDEAQSAELTPSHAAFEPTQSLQVAAVDQSRQSPSHDNDQRWRALQQAVAACRACKLCETRTQTVFGVGNRQARWMLIGEAPGQNEDLQGEPFVGKAGQLLTEMLRAVGLKREDVFIANVLKCRPPNNRDPQADEVAACHDFLERQIALIQPRLIVAVGRIAAQNLLKTQQPLAKLRGARHQLDDYPLVVVHHPAYLLRTLTEKAKAWEDLQFALSVYQSLERQP